MNSHPNSQSTPAISVYGACRYCGAVTVPMVHAYGADGSACRLWCVDEAACTGRQDAEAAWAETRISITDKGRRALEVYRSENERAIRAPRSDDILVAFACLGAAALVCSNFSNYGKLLKPANDGGGSGCGGGGGSGCGGGGCGGCGS